MGHCALRRGRFSLAQHGYFITTSTVGRQPFFADFTAACAASRCFADPAILRGATLLAWVLMPDHVHWLLQLDAKESLEQVINRLKSASARHANRALGRQGALWIKAYYDRALYDDRALPPAADYLIANPLRAGLVERIEDYPFWDCVWR